MKILEIDFGAMIFAFIGKGGVGKTTIASAAALDLSRIGRTTLVSSDFMPSLKYLFPSNPENLDVFELNQKEVSEKWKKTYGDEVVTVLSNLFEVEDWILDHVAESPGVAEEFMISNIMELDSSDKYDYVVWDTAASSSTMHLIFLQKEFYDHLSRDVKIYLKLRDSIRSDKMLTLLERWRMLATNVWNQLLSTKFFLVTTGDELSIVQAGQIQEDLRTMGIEVAATICNRGGDECNDKNKFNVPENRGSARDIVDSVSRRLIDNGMVELLRRLAKDQKV
ncbi:MAG: ArsA family ATPase [Thermoplasmata archaeon]